MSNKTLRKSGRLVLLHLLRADGVIDDLTLQAIGDILGVDRSTIHRDLRELDAVEHEYRRLLAQQPWIRRELTTAEFAEEIGASADTVRMMINDGLIDARKVHWGVGGGKFGRWMIPVEETERFKRQIE
jgi:predicted DNA-binding protein YlxM (UPF0122 family)